MKKYTVIGYYADNDQPFVDWVSAKDPSAAAAKALRLKDENYAPRIVEVLKGHHKGVLGNSKTLNQGVRLYEHPPV